MKLPLIVRPVTNPTEWQHARRIREEVFIIEQGCPPDEEWDAYDAISRHLLGFAADEPAAVAHWRAAYPVAVARWRAAFHDNRSVAKLERFAVRASHRHRGYGRAMVQATMDDARAAGFDTFYVHAQAHLEVFYASLGYRTVTDVFIEAGIPHVGMLCEAQARRP